MSDEIRVNRPTQQPVQRMESQQPSMPSAGQMPPMGMMPEQGGRSKMPWIILAVVVVVLAGLGILFRQQLFGSKNNAEVKGAMTTNSSGYQAVFLTNGQVYFGKLSDATADYVTLKDIYYLQVVQPPQLQGTPPQGQQQQAPAQQQAAQPQISLVKLGNELHGPVDEMHISRSQVLFYEDLKSDGQVVKAIADYKANPAK